LTQFNPAALAALRTRFQRRLAEGRLYDYEPYPKQFDFHDAGADSRERLFMAGNQTGKTWAGGAEVAIHATGEYPKWWKGKVFEKPVVGWVAGVSGELTRDGPQRILMGRAGAWGTGMIPYARIKRYDRRSHGVKDSLETIIVHHGGGADVQMGESIIGFKSYDQGREKFQAETLDFLWFDEEPDLDIYIEGVTRTNTTGGIVFMTFTPLKGMSAVVMRFLIEQARGTVVVRMTIEDALHYTAEQREAIIATYPEFQRDARAQGIPQLGSGMVFPVTDHTLFCDPFEIPRHWPQIGGIDFGWDHPSGAARLAHDRDNDALFVTATHKMREATPLIFAPVVKKWGDWLPIAWPHDGLQHDKGSGLQLAEQYRDNGLNMLPERATFDDGTSNVEPGITGMLERMQTGRFKVFKHLSDWQHEKALYYRKDGIIVPLNDDVISATRYAFMMRRFASVKPSEKRAAVERQRSWRTA
jgi:phage terminase large subunit-like protein